MILVQINFDFPRAMMGERLLDEARGLAESINQEPGFISKIWIENSQTDCAGGIYLFENQETAENYVAMHTQRLQKMGVASVRCEYFGVHQALSEINHGLVAKP